MSDAQLPPETGEGESDPTLQSGVPPGDVGVVTAVRLEALNGDQLMALPGSGSDRVMDDVAAQAPPPEPGEHDTTSEAASNDDQPMLDLRFPDAPPQVHLPGEAQPLTLEPMDQEFSADPPVPPDADGFGLQPLLDVGETAAETEPPVEVSPIFTALDAAERADQEVHREAAPQPDPDATDILLPRSELTDRAEETVAPAILLPASEPQAIDPHEGSTHSLAAAIEAVAAPEPPLQYAGVPPEAEEQTPPAEMLSDDAAARIAAEASATAAALENLKRLLANRLPEPNVVPAPIPRDTSRERPEPPPIPDYRPAVHLPVSPPPMVAAPTTGTSLSFADYDDAPSRRRWVSVGSFFAGFALSWVLGAVLYVFLTGG